MSFYILIIKGFLLGCTAIIPGISIGTMALVLGVYTKAIEGFSLIASPSKWNKQVILHLLVSFFTPLLIGTISAMILLAAALSWLLNTYPIFVLLCFTGIIIGSIPYIWHTHIKQYNIMSLIPFIILGVCSILFFAFSKTWFSIDTNNTSHTLLQISLPSIIAAFFFGMLSSACGLIPGISGSFVLLILGYYNIYLTIIKTLHFPLLIPILIGHIMGFIAVSVLIKFLLHRFTRQSFGTILGMVLASVIAIFPWDIITTIPSLPQRQIIPYLLLSLASVGLGLLVSKVNALNKE